MVQCSLFRYRNKLDVSIHFSWISSIVLALARVAALILIIVRFISFAESNQNTVIYLTFYGFVITWIYFSLVVLDLLISKLVLKNYPTVTRIIGDCINILYQVAFQIEFTLTLLYWIVLYSPSTFDPWGFNNLGVHGMPLLLLLVDFVLNSFQFPIRHLIVTFIIGAIYILINQVRTCKGDAVYEQYPCGDVILPLVAFVVLTLVHMIGHLVWKFLRSKKIQKIQGKSSSNSLLVDQNSELIS